MATAVVTVARPRGASPPAHGPEPRAARAPPARCRPWPSSPGPATVENDESPASLDLALVALDDLDVVINGWPPGRSLAGRSQPGRSLEAAVERWRGVAARRERRSRSSGPRVARS